MYLVKLKIPVQDLATPEGEKIYGRRIQLINQSQEGPFWQVKYTIMKIVQETSQSEKENEWVHGPGRTLYRFLTQHNLDRTMY